MNPRLGFICLLLGAALVCGCAGKKQAGQEKTLFRLNFGFKTVNKCSGVSPEIDMQNLPPGTKKVNVKVLDLDFGLTVYDNTLGFETTDTGLYLKDNSGKIPEGKLKNFQGPCPGDKPHEYEVDIRATDENGLELGRAKATETVKP